MMRKIAFVIMFLNTIPLLSETLFVSGNALYVRQSPDVKSSTLNLIPNSTPLNVVKTSIKQRIGNHHSFWYKLQHPLNGYVYGGFLSKNLDGTKKTILHSHTQKTGTSIKKRMIFDNGRATEIIYSEKGHHYQVRVGRYKIYPNGIAIMYSRSTSMIDEKQFSESKNKYLRLVPITIKAADFLHWTHWIKGFSTKDSLRYTKKMNIKSLNRNHSQLLLSNHDRIGFYNDRIELRMPLPKSIVHFLKNDK